MKANKDGGTSVGFSKGIIAQIKDSPEVVYKTGNLKIEDIEQGIQDYHKTTAMNTVSHQNVWIRVRDKKPRKGKYVLLYNGHWIGVGKYQPNSESVYEPKWQDETTEYIHPIPTHWQPLPNPPKK